MNQPIKMPRRNAIVGMGTAVAVAATERGFAADSTAHANDQKQTPMLVEP